MIAWNLPHPKRTPFTFWYLVLLLATTIVVKVVDTTTADGLALAPVERRIGKWWTTAERSPS